MLRVLGLLAVVAGVGLAMAVWLHPRADQDESYPVRSRWAIGAALVGCVFMFLAAVLVPGADVWSRVAAGIACGAWFAAALRRAPRGTPTFYRSRPPLPAQIIGLTHSGIWCVAFGLAGRSAPFHLFLLAGALLILWLGPIAAILASRQEQGSV